MSPVLLAIVLCVAIVGICAVACVGLWPSRFEVVAPVEPPTRKPVAMPKPVVKCPIDHCRIKGPHSHVEALLRRIKEDKRS